MTNRSPSCGAGVLVLAGPAAALLITVFSLATGTGADLLGGALFGAVLWSFLAALSCALWRGFRHGDWTAFTRYRLPEGRGERFDWSTRSGRYAWRREIEEQELYCHDPGFPFP